MTYIISPFCHQTHCIRKNNSVSKVTNVTQAEITISLAICMRRWNSFAVIICHSPLSWPWRSFPLPLLWLIRSVVALCLRSQTVSLLKRIPLAPTIVIHLKRDDVNACTATPDCIVWRCNDVFQFTKTKIVTEKCWKTANKLK